jgi:precorrin-6Y C5,15-methyltransferase (decarboxylating)
MIDVVGIGLEGATGLPRSIRDIIDRAAVLVGSHRHLRYFPDHPAKQWVLRDLEGDLRGLQSLGQGEAIAILASGDPLFFGLGRLLLEIFDPAQLTFHPHLSSIQLAFSRVKLPWQDAQFLSVHGRSLDILIPYLKQGIAKIALLTDSTSHPGAIAGLMLSLGLTCDYDCWICENLGSSNERVQRYAADKLFQLAARSASDFAPLNVVILQKNRNYTEIDLQDLPLIGIPDRAFASFSDRPGLMTKREVRLQVLGQLRLQPDQIFWDIGAGTGSVSIEVARLCPSSQVFAIEKTAAGIQLIQTNCQRFQVDNVKAIAGAAPDSLKDLPTPDRIFIGGTGGNLGTILDFCGEKLKERGLIVLAFATVEHLAEAIAWLQSQHWQYELLQVNLSQSVVIADAHRFSPLNPVTLVTAYPLHPSIQELKIEQ